LFSTLKSLDSSQAIEDRGRIELCEIKSKLIWYGWYSKATYRLVYSMQAVQQSYRFHPHLPTQGKEAYSKLSHTEKIKNKKIKKIITVIKLCSRLNSLP
jgi:hypothetical protein